MFWGQHAWVGALAFGLVAECSVWADEAGYGQREEVLRFGQEMAQQHGLDAAWVQAQLAQARYVPAAARLIMPPPTGQAKNWVAYRARFVEPSRVRAGLRFWQENQAWLAKAEQVYGVPPEVVVGIVGVETMYGQQMGGFRTLDVLATLAFDFPAGRSDRSGFFRDELAQLLVLSERAGREAGQWRGSYAGAMGMGQFMPSSWNVYGVDFDGDGVVDMHGSSADVVGSVAHYLAEFGWRRGVASRFEVTPPVGVRERALLLVPDVKPTWSALQLDEQGAVLSPEGQAYEGLMALVELQNGAQAPSYVAGTENFYALTRYNWSSYYAMAVLALGEQVGWVYRRTYTPRN